MKEDNRNKITRSNKKNRAKEPESSYQVTPESKPFKTVTIASLEKQEDDMRKYSVRLTPFERIAYLYDLIELAYGHILKRTPRNELWEKKIHFHKE